MSNEQENEDIKVILVGEPGTGKTSLINVAIGNKFVENAPSTLISTFVQKKFTKNNKDHILNIWDTTRKIQSNDKNFHKKFKNCYISICN